MGLSATSSCSFPPSPVPRATCPARLPRERWGSHRCSFGPPSGTAGERTWREKRRGEKRTQSTRTCGTGALLPSPHPRGAGRHGNRECDRVPGGDTGFSENWWVEGLEGLALEGGGWTVGAASSVASSVLRQCSGLVSPGSSFLSPAHHQQGQHHPGPGLPWGRAGPQAGTASSAGHWE